jgi:hypothetical protein
MMSMHGTKATMRRVQFIELHEQPWFPSSLRDQITDALQCGVNLLNAYAPIAPMLRGVMNSMGNQSIVDICSGGGGPWLHLSRILSNGACEFQIRLTDKYPNLRAFETMRAASENQVTFCRDPVDALRVPRELGGLRTMFSSFHHFSRERAAAILQDAVDARKGIGIFEITRRAPSAIGWMFPWAFLAFVYTPLIRPFRWSRLIWTYVIPLIPLILLFDGIVSCLRTYKPQEMQEIIATLTQAEYEWQVGEHRIGTDKMPITYLIGRPKDSSSFRDTR